MDLHGVTHACSREAGIYRQPCQRRHSPLDRDGRGWAESRPKFVEVGFGRHGEMVLFESTIGQGLLLCSGCESCSFDDTMFDFDSQKIGVCLSSGYFGFYAHCGIMKALRETGLRPAAITGCSAGAVVGALWASGLAVEEVERVLLTADWRLLVDPPSFSRLIAAPFGFVKGHKFETSLTDSLPVHRVEDCPIPFATTTFDLEEGRLKVIKSGSLARAVRASASLPAMFGPVPVEGHLCWDGAVVEKIALRPMMEMEGIDTILLCYLPRPRPDGVPRSIVGGLRLALDRVIGELDRERVAIARAEGMEIFVISPEVPRSGPHRMGEGASIIDIARQETRRILVEQDFSEVFDSCS